MAVQRRVNWISQQRVDVPDMRSVESAVSNDFDQLIQGFVTNTAQGYILRGFEISMTGAIGGAASNLQMVVDPGAVMHIAASQSGTLLMVPPGTAPQQLNGATNTNVNGAFSPNALNYIGLDYTRFVDPTTSAQVYIWDPTTQSETTKTAPRAQVLEYQISISTTTWPANILPIAIVQTDAGNNVVAITDCRWLLFRLGTGGANPDPFYTYPWNAQPEGRTENPSSSSSNGVNPFEGGDKMLFSLKDWMNAVMSLFLEINGGTYWYSGGGSSGGGGSIVKLREDAVNTITVGQGVISHGVLPNNDPVLTTTGAITSGSDQLTGLASTTGLVAGQFIFGTGIPYNTTIESIAGPVVTMSKLATLTNPSVTVNFFSPAVVTAPGQINWSDPFYLKVIGSGLSYAIAANPSSTDITLADDDVAYIILTRDAAITPNLFYTYNIGPNTTTVVSIGAVPWTSGLAPGDFIRASADADNKYTEVKTVDSLTQVTLYGNYVPSGQTLSGVKSVYALGSYQASASPSGPRDIFIANRAAVPIGQNTFWLMAREDVGGTNPLVYLRFLGQELAYGSSDQIDDGIPKQLLQYIGSPSESASKPQYVSAINPGSLAQTTQITSAAASAISSGQYFYFESSNDSRKYYFWFKKDGTGTDPAPAADRIGVQINITTGQTAPNVAVQIKTAFDDLTFPDFSTSIVGSTLTVVNNSAGVCSPAVNVNVSAPFAIVVTQNGTGTGNNVINDGDSLTLAIKKLDQYIGLIAAGSNNPNYDEAVEITASVMAGTNLTLPLNTRSGSIQQTYTVGKGALQLFLNGQYQNLTTATIPSESAMLRYHMDDASFPTNDVLSGAKVGGEAYKYTPVSSVSLKRIRFILGRSVAGTGTGALVAKVHADSASLPGTTLGTTASFPVSSLIAGFNTQVEFIFSSPISLTGGTTYWFSLETDSAYQAVNGTTGCDVHVRNPNVVTSVTAPGTIENHTATNNLDLQLGSVASGIVAGAYFTADITAKITSASQSVTYVSGTGNITATLYSLVQDNITNVPTLTFIESSTAKDITTLPAPGLNPALTAFTFAGTNTLTSGVDYVIMMSVDNVGGNNVRFNRLNGGARPADAGLIFKNTGTDNLYHASVGSTNPNVYSGDQNISVTGNVTTTGGEYPVANYNGTSWVSAVTGTPATELDITGANVSNYDWTEVGTANTLSSTIRIDRNLVPGDVLTYRIGVGSGGGGGGGGTGPQGPVGPPGPPGLDAVDPVNVSTKNSNYSVTLTDKVLLANCTSAPITFTLPSPSTANGRMFFFKKIDSSANALSIVVSGGANIDFLASQSTTVQGYSWTLVCDGTQYWLL